MTRLKTPTPENPTKTHHKESPAQMLVLNTHYLILLSTVPPGRPVRVLLYYLGSLEKDQLNLTQPPTETYQLGGERDTADAPARSSK